MPFGTDEGRQRGRDRATARQQRNIQTAIELRRKRWSNKRIATQLRVTERTVERWFAQRREKGEGVERPPRPYNFRMTL